MQITVVDSTDLPSPEERAVLQALASRSLKPMSDQLNNISKEKADSFTERHIIGYGHDSVHENADGIIISCSDVSILAAKALEDNSLFRGTEASTRYIDFSNQKFETANPTQIELSEIQRKFYLENLPLVADHFRTVFPISGDDDPAIYNRAINAKAFDVMRAFLPAGATTMVNWATDIRTAKRHLASMLHHPLWEVRTIASSIIAALRSRYPVSMSGDLGFEHIGIYVEEYHYLDENPTYHGVTIWNNENYKYNQLDVAFVEKDLDNIENNYPSLTERPCGCPLPRIYSSRFTVSGLIDYGSFRDIQRHRNGVCKIPVLTTTEGFETWYLDQLPDEVAKRAEEHLDLLESQLNNDIFDQYVTPMGYRIPFILDYSMEQLVYFAELRSSKHVHPTARNPALHVADFLEKYAPFVKIYVDRSDSPFNVNRGTHTITQR